MALWPAVYGDADRSYLTVYDDYDRGPNLDPTFAHESGEPELIEYNNSFAYYTYDSFATSSELNYSVYSYSEPKLLQYDPSDQYHSYNYYQSYVNPSETSYIQPRFLQYEPSPSHVVYFPSETKFTVSYSSSEFNEPEFEEYDPTPYGGGYDPIATYGEPLPPSEATCYPPTLPQADNNSLQNFPFSSIPSPYGKDDDLDPPASKPPNADKVPGDGNENLPPKPPNGDKVSGVMIPINDPPGPCESELGIVSEKQMLPQYSYGSGLEAIDLCESLFGYLPCIAKHERNKCRACNQEIGPEPWGQRAADYLFGTPVMYDDHNYQHW